MGKVYSSSIIFPESNKPFEEILMSVSEFLNIKCSIELNKEDRLRVVVYSTKSKMHCKRELANLLKQTAQIVELPREVKFRDIKVEELNQDKYLLSYEKFFKPVEIAGKIIILPYTVTPSKGRKRDISEVLIEPGLAFGTGMHATTQLCLEALTDKQIQDGKVIDAGTGSGILAIAAARLGASVVYAFDVDETAFESAMRNIKLNSVEDRVLLYKDDFGLLSDLPFCDYMVANLTFEELVENASAISKAKVGELLLSGFLEEETQKLFDTYSKYGFRQFNRRAKKGWGLLELTGE